MARRRDQNGAAWRKARARVIASEDVCALCGRLVDKTLPHQDPMSVEVDHIVPVSHGGHLTARSNLQLTHKVCNRRKGDLRARRFRAPILTSRTW